MNLKGLDLFLVTKLLSSLVDQVTCLECCKYYIAPESAPCGHTLCHTCWRTRRTCPVCAATVDKRTLRVNLTLQNQTEHVHAMSESFENKFNIKLDEFVLDETSNHVESEHDPTKNVKDWLASSQNQFSAPLLNSEQFSEEVNPVQISSSKIQVHVDSKKSKSPDKVVYVQPPQDDWDKIEQVPDTEELGITNKENSTNHTNKQPSLIYDKEYTTDNPRRSSRKRDLVALEQINDSHDINTEKHSSKNTSSETDKKSNKAKQNWNNVKRMRKEFSKLNKKNRSKLNVSIEMCKKTQSTAKPHNDLVEHHKILDKESQPAIYTIEDNTPDVIKNDKIQNMKHAGSQKSNENDIQNKIPDVSIMPDYNCNNGNNSLHKENNPAIVDNNDNHNHNIQQNNSINNENSNKEHQSTKNKMPFIKKGVLCPQQYHSELICNPAIKIHNDLMPENANGDDDIEITIKIGNTLTNITIKKKNNDVQLRVNTDRQVQTSLGSNCLINKNSEPSITNDNNKQQDIEISISKDNNVSAFTTQPESKNVKMNVDTSNILMKSVSTKKNTASAETATAQFEITESVEKELSNIMECVEVVDSNTEKNNGSEKNDLTSEIAQQAVNVESGVAANEEDYINDLDIFDNGSVHEQIVQSLNKSKQAPSEILMPTTKYTKTQTQKHPDKRDRDVNEDDEVPSAKKIKTVFDKDIELERTLNNTLMNASPKNIVQNSESINYDVVMGQVFASIDADIEMSQKTAKNKNEEIMGDVETEMQSQCFQSKTQNKEKKILGTQNTNSRNVVANINEKCSENVFSIIEKDDETEDMIKKTNNKCGSTQQHIDNLLTPGMCQDLISTHEDKLEVVDKVECTPHQEHYDSDKSVVEETPQKNVSIPKQKSVSEFNNNAMKQPVAKLIKVASNNSQVGRSVINVSDTLVDTTEDQTIIEAVAQKNTLETPLTINKFVDHIKHNSTPMARKSLNFENVEEVDLQQTLCPSSIASKTTQEKEFMTKAFEQTPKSPIKRLMTSKILNAKELNYCIAGSCLSAVEIANVKLLCKRFNWKYVDKYSRELTHLVVGVDEENRSQRSVKYMCALAASKWIVSYDWVKACLLTNVVAGENLYEALDGTGEPGPRRSRTAKGKLFAGITFFCMPPFSVLDVDALKEMLESAGGRVVTEAKAVRAADGAPALLLAEPEHTQEDRFVYLALELSIVPVNYEWVLNCLGSYTLSSIHELLLCPAALLPPATNTWPPALMSRDSY